MAGRPKKQKVTGKQVQAMQAAREVLLLTQALARFVAAGAEVLSEGHGFSEKQCADWAKATIARSRAELAKDGDDGNP